MVGMGVMQQGIVARDKNRPFRARVHQGAGCRNFAVRDVPGTGQHIGTDCRHNDQGRTAGECLAAGKDHVAAIVREVRFEASSTHRFESINIVVARHQMNTEIFRRHAIHEILAALVFIGRGGRREIASQEELFNPQGCDVLAIRRSLFHVKFVSAPIDDVGVAQKSFVEEHRRIGHDLPEVEVGDVYEAVGGCGHDSVARLDLW